MALAFACLAAVRAWLWARRAVRLHALNVTRSARVRGLAEGSVSVADIPFRSIVWNEEDGRTGTSRLGLRWRLPEEGATITVCADPEGRLASVWQDDVTV